MFTCQAFRYLSGAAVQDIIPDRFFIMLCEHDTLIVREAL